MLKMWGFFWSHWYKVSQTVCLSKEIKSSFADHLDIKDDRCVQLRVAHSDFSIRVIIAVADLERCKKSAGTELVFLLPPHHLCCPLRTISDYLIISDCCRWWVQEVELLSSPFFFLLVTFNNTQHFFCPFTLSCSVLSSSS